MSVSPWRAARLAPQAGFPPPDTDAWERVRLDALNQILPVAAPRKPPTPAADENDVVVRNQRNGVGIPAASKVGTRGGGAGKRQGLALVHFSAQLEPFLTHCKP